METSVESLRRPLVIGLGSSIVFVTVLFFGALFVALRPAQAAADGTAQRSVTANPSCMRRVTITSNPCGATIYIDSIQVGRTPLSFPMPTGRYTLILLAPGHQQYGRRILVADAPLAIDANLIPNN